MWKDLAKRVGVFLGVLAIAGCGSQRFERVEGVPMGDPTSIGWQSNPVNRSGLALDKKTALVVSVHVSYTTNRITLSRPQILVVDPPRARKSDVDTVELVANDSDTEIVGTANVPLRRYYVSEGQGLVEAESQSFVATLVLDGIPAEVVVRDAPPELASDVLDVEEMANRFCNDFPRNTVCADSPVVP